MPADFSDYSLILYYGYSHAHGYVYIPNIMYKSLDVRCTVVFYNYTFRERDDVGACCNSCHGAGCNTVSVEKIGAFLG